MRIFNPKNDFKVHKAYLTCALDYNFDNSSKEKLLKNFSINKGNCRSNNLIISGIDIKKIISKVDNMNTFQDFFDIFNFKKFNGFTKFDSIFFNFKMKKKMTLKLVSWRLKMRF